MLAIPALARGADGRLTLDAEGWTAVEGLLGAVAELAGDAVGAEWPLALARLLGWRPEAGAGPRLELATLVADPAAALEAFARALFAVGDGAASVERLLDLLATLLAGAARGATRRGPARAAVAAAARRRGRGADGGASPAGPETPPTLITGALRAWQPGDPGLDPETLFGDLAVDATLEDALADLLARRGDLAAGLVELLERWVGTDGLVALPDGVLPAGVNGVRADDLAHAAPLGLRRPRELARRVAAGDRGSTWPSRRPAARPCSPAASWTGSRPSGVLDLTGAGPPEATAVPAAAPGVWAVRLGSRADCRLAAGDPDGVAGQAARLRRALAPLAAGGAAVIAHGGAGHAALRAAPDLPGLVALVTVGTPWSPVTVDVLDRQPAAETLRLLGGAAAAGRRRRAGRPRPGAGARADRRPARARPARRPAGRAAPARRPRRPARRRGARRRRLDRGAGGAARRHRGGCGGARRGRPRRARRPARPPRRRPGWGSGCRSCRASCAAASWPRSTADVDLVDLGAGAAGPALTVRVELASGSGWLAGGPDPGRTAGIPRPLALRRLTALVRVPLLPGAAGTRATLVLHDASVFGVARQRWVVALGPDAPAEATALLPEVRALLGEVARRLAAPVAELAPLRDALTALGVLDPSGGADAGTLEQLLFDPAATVSAALGDSTRRAALAAALRALTGDARAAAGDSVRVVADGVTADVDLAARSVAVTASGPARCRGPRR